SGSGQQSRLTIPTDIVMMGTFHAGVGRNTALVSMPAGGAPFQQWVIECTQNLATKRSNKTAILGADWAISLHGHSLGNILLAPNPKSPNCTTNGAASLLAPGMYTLSSAHPAGANVLLTDGSVKFLKDSTNVQVIWGLGSRDQGEIISADAY